MDHRRKQYLLLVLFLITGFDISAQELKYEGKIAGQYEIEMELSSKDDMHFTGRYHYKDKDQWLMLTGTITGETQSTLLLKELDPAGKQTGSFSLNFDAENLNGTWQAANSAKPLGVVLQLRDEEQEAIGNSSLPDGYYYIADNEMKIRTIDSNTIEAAVWISNNRSCTGILLRGKLTASPKGWTGLLPDEYEHGKAVVTIRFEGSNANILIEPKFAPGADCYISASPYIRGRKKQDSELD